MWQVINLQSIKSIKREQIFGKLSILTQSRKYKLGEISFSVFQFYLVHFSVQVPTRLWYKSSHGLIGKKGIYIGFNDIVALVGK